MSTAGFSLQLTGNHHVKWASEVAHMQKRAIDDTYSWSIFSPGPTQRYIRASLRSKYYTKFCL